MAERHAYRQTSEGLTRRGRGTSLVQHSQTTTYLCDIGNATIDMLPDEVLVEIFELYIEELGDEEDWETLLHVCRRWRQIAFAAPRRLELRIVCTAGTPARALLDVWPTLPILVRVVGLDDEDLDNVVAAVEHNNRISEIYIKDVSNYALERIAAAMQRPFPEMTDCVLVSFDEIVTDLPDSLLGGSAPRLRSLMLESIPFPALPNLLLSATNLVRLRLNDVPASGYIPLEAMVDCLSLLTGLEELQLEYRSSYPLFDQTSRRLLPLTRTVLPVLTRLSFHGVAEYLEGIFASIEAPLLECVHITFLSPGIFDVSRVSMFIGRTKRFEGFDQAHIHFDQHFVNVTLSSRKGATGGVSLKFSVRCIGSVWQLQYLSRNHSRFVPPLRDLERFDLREFQNRLSPLWTDGMESATSRWLELLRHFTSVETLYLSEGLAHCVAPALKGLTEDDVNGVLPTLQTLLIETPTIGTCPGGHWGVCRHERAHWSPRRSPMLVRERGPYQLFRELMLLLP